MAVSPDSRKIVTGAGDETIRFWKTFGYENQKYNFYNNEPSLNLLENDEIIDRCKSKKDNLLSNFDIR